MSKVTVAYTHIAEAAARRLVDVAIARATEQQVAICVVVLDAEGVLKAFARMDGATVVAVDACQAKARAALMGLGSQQLGEALKDNLPNLISVANLPGMTLLGGGLPIYHETQLIGAIAVGGSSTEIDIAIAEAALQAL